MGSDARDEREEIQLISVAEKNTDMYKQASSLGRSMRMEGDGKRLRDGSGLIKIHRMRTAISSGSNTNLIVSGYIRCEKKYRGRMPNNIEHKKARSRARDNHDTCGERRRKATPAWVSE